MYCSQGLRVPPADKQSTRAPPLGATLTEMYSCMPGFCIYMQGCHIQHCIHQRSLVSIVYSIHMHSCMWDGAMYSNGALAGCGCWDGYLMPACCRTCCDLSIAQHVQVAPSEVD